MPAGGSAIGYVAFALVKAAGYVAISKKLKLMSGLTMPQPSHYVVGLTRTVVGIAAGLTYGWAWFTLGPRMDAKEELFYLLLLPVRIAEWGVVLWYFFGRDRQPPAGFYWKAILLGTIVSYGLDVVGVVAAFIVPGGFWIC